MRRITGIILLALTAALGINLETAGADEARGRLRGASAATGCLGARRLALCIGIDGYRGGTYKRLRYAAADAKRLAATFTAIGYETTLLVDGDASSDDSRIPTYRNLDDRIHEFCRASTRSCDTLIVTFSGHGDVIDGQSVLIPLDYAKNGRTVTVGALFDALRLAKAKKKLLVLDACRSSQRDGARTLQSGFLQSLGVSESIVVLSGCGADQFAFEDAALGHGRLTKCLVDGLEGEAFLDGREFLFGHELWGYVERTFHARSWSEEQSPTMFGTWDARVRFDVARRDVEPPPPISGEDREIFDMTLARAIARSREADHTSSVKFSTTALRILPRDPRALARRAFAYLGLGYRERARQDAEVILEQDADHPLALLVQTSLALAAEDLDAAFAWVRRMSEASDSAPGRWMADVPDDVCAAFWLNVGHYYGKQGVSVEAQLSAYQAALDRKGAPPHTLAQVYINRGLLHYGEARYDDAIADFRAVIDLEGAPKRLLAFAHFDLGRIYGDAVRYDEAITEYTEALGFVEMSEQTRADAHHNRGLFFAHAKCYEEARADFEAALADSAVEMPTVNSALWQLGLLDGVEGRPADAAARYEAQLEARKGNVFLWTLCALGYGNLMVSIGEPAAAIPVFERIVRREGVTDFMAAQAWNHLGALFTDGRRFDEALEVLDRCLAEPIATSLHPLAWNRRGFVLEALGRPDDAAACYARLHDFEYAATHHKAEGRLRHAILDVRRGRLDAALAKTESVLARKGVIEDYHLLAHVIRAQVHARAGRADEARASLGRAAELRSAFAPSVALAWAGRARALALLGDEPESAAQALEGTQVPLDGAGAIWMDGVAAVGRHQWKEALASFRQALAAGPLPAHVRYALGELTGRTGEPAETTVLQVWLRRASGESDLDAAPIQAYATENPDAPLAVLAE